ncbi:MAG TPA: HAD-IIIC family phosphatase [Acetobacteraceae bacterium]|nr:HAD-IIIC family phosphatase [Acetobacteraceae bacterium]
MLDTLVSPSRVLRELQQAWAEKPPSLAAIFQGGERLAALVDAADVERELPAQRIAVLGAATIDYLSRAIACAVAQEDVFPVLYQAPFGAYVQEALNPGSALHGFAPELAVIAPEARDLIEALPPGASAAEVSAAIETKVALFGRVWDALTARGCRVVQHLLVPPVEQYRGVAERFAPASAFNQVRALNDALLAAGHGRVQWVDLERLAAAVGARRFSASRFWYSARLGFDQRFLPDYLPAFRGAWRAACARGKKVLALDLDNTLWGGVIGDDGVEGLSLGPGSPEGEAFADWQRYLQALGARGVVLAVCSKNAPEIAETGFRHPGAVLRRTDFAAFECSWNDKVAGLRRIAEALNLGLDSIVFADDNPAECALIRRALPEVAVVELGPEPAEFPALLDAGHWFDMADLTAEDLSRTEAYAARAGAEAARERHVRAGATDLDSYLASLAMTGRLYRPQEPDIARVAQLEQKTNQFNLTTRRYSEAAIRAFLSRDDAVVLAFRLADRFGDHGLTSTLIAVREGDTLRIDSWLMSCRIFSRTAEAFILRGLLAIARQRGVRRIVGEYVATAKNGVVADLYARLGFVAVGDGTWGLQVGAPESDRLATAIGSQDAE